MKNQHFTQQEFIQRKENLLNQLKSKHQNQNGIILFFCKF